MKKLACLLIAVIMLSAIPELVSAQSNDPFEQQVIQTKPSSKQSNNPRRRRTNTEEVTPAPTPAPAPAPQPQPQPEAKQPNNGMTISNSCSDWLDFELVSLVGSKGSQTVSLTIKFTVHSTNTRMGVGSGFVAYDCDGVEHSGSYGGSYSCFTDVPVKASINIYGKINPNTTTVMPVISFLIGDCRIEMRNVPIDWR